MLLLSSRHSLSSRRRAEQGFTLVELAIVLMIIGLLIAGILRGQELMNNARLGTIVRQVTAYTGAINTFRDAYSNLPGDMPTATARLPNCGGCSNGNGDSMIGTMQLTWYLNDQSIGSENAQFWRHLAATHIISGVNPRATLVTFGQSHPVSPIGGGFSVVTAMQDPADPRGSAFNGAMVLRLHGDLLGGTNTIIEDNPVISPKEAAYIDRKMDDGIPNTGDVQGEASGTGARVAGGTQSDCEGTATTGYVETDEFKLCTMAFLMNR